MADVDGSQFQFVRRLKGELRFIVSQHITKRKGILSAIQYSTYANMGKWIEKHCHMLIEFAIFGPSLTKIASITTHTLLGNTQ